MLTDAIVVEAHARHHPEHGNIQGVADGDDRGQPRRYPLLLGRPGRR
jgi:hypothetical protein